MVRKRRLLIRRIKSGWGLVLNEGAPAEVTCSGSGSRYPFSDRVASTCKGQERTRLGVYTT